jgi:hypothetical protein
VTNLDFHPLANLFPLLEGDEFDALVEDVRTKGLLVPIVVHDGKILSPPVRCAPRSRRP